VTATPDAVPDGSVGDQLVTVVIPARDEEAFIEPCLASVLEQTHHDLQVIVVDGASVDRTPEIVREWARRDPRVELLHNPRGLIPISLNLALAAARGRWFVRVDAHAVVPPDYVAAAVRHLASGRWGGVGGRKDGVGRTPAGRAVAAAMGSPFGVGNSAYHYAAEPQTVEHIPFGAYPVALARELGGWDERLAVNQDFEFDHRVVESGHELLLDPAMVIEWHCRQSLRGLFKQYHRYGRGKVAVARLHPGSVRARHLAAPALVGSWLVALLALLGGRRRSAVALTAPYAAALLAASAWTARTVPGWSARARLPGAFLAMHAAWGLGFWRGTLAALTRRSLPGGPSATDARPVSTTTAT
jgi:succinoglycan biosynthesis protein ExoA